tara:strand:- start:23 stop:232 length:210 start_codon:yes stop_codon:yes gene_type:complete
MNDRIRQLAEQVGAVRNVLAMGRHDGVLFTDSELEKFAELIVRECLSYAKDGDLDFMKFMIKKHFGVEE